MEVCGQRELLLSLLETIAFYCLPNLEAIAATAKTKEANAYGWDDRRGLLYIARQKKITIFRHVGNVLRMKFCEGGFVDRHEQLLLEHVGEERTRNLSSRPFKVKEGLKIQI
ncbi:hypothetical protein QJS10_CPB20g00829 [Acorus calamus]|uniref:Uncharacterized protein n=1 Tax=Acorus calamus TaxID=4465 RepID=A0AAV9CAP5_ACOCL|nr:hypothetical protein QJS10_CPB20g00829 [Acorus calamus]